MLSCRIAICHKSIAIKDLTYSERLQNLSLSYRRNCMDLIMTYKILNENVLADKDYFLQ